MAEWIDTGDGYARAPNGQEVPIELLPPGERVVPAAATPAPLAAPVAPGGDMPVAPSAPAASLTPAAQAVVSKLDNPAIAAARGQPSSQLPIAQQSTTTQGAVPMSVLEPVMDRGTARAETQANAAIQAGEERARIGEQQAMTAATAAYGQQQQSQAEAEQARQRAEIARQNQIAIAAQEDPSIDPDRFVRSMSTGQSIGTVILAAIEGAFRGMTGQPGQSGVLNILERRIDQDIAAQKEQIASGRIRRGNMIQYFREQGMNEEAAEKSARAMALAQAEKLTQAEIARQGAGYAREEGKALAEQIKAAREQANDELVLTLGTPRSSTTTVRAQPAAGGSGAEGFTKMLAARKAYEESGATPEQLAAFDRANGLGAMAPGGVSSTQRSIAKDAELSEAQGKSQAAADAINELGTAAGLTRDPKTGKWSGGSNVFREGSFWDTDGEYNSRFEAAVEAYGRMQSGGVIGEEEREAFRDMLSARRANVLANKLNAAEVTIRSRQKAERVGGNDAEKAGFKPVSP